MKNENITGGFKKLKQDLAGMSFQEKAEHIWTYYRSWVIVAVAILMLISIFVSSFINLTTTTLVTGASLNVTLQDDAKAYMSAELKPLLASGTSREDAHLEVAYTTDSIEENYYLQQNIFALISSHDLDYVILDKTAMDLILSGDPFMDLREAFTEEELAELSVHNVQYEGEEPVPALIDISDWAIVQNSGNKKFYFAIIGNTERLDAVKTALAHMQNYGK